MRPVKMGVVGLGDFGRQHALTLAGIAEAELVALAARREESLAEAESLAAFVRPDQTNLMLGHIVLFNSEFRQLQDEVRRRGPVRYMDWVRHRPAANLRKFLGENPMHLTMVHDLYATQALLERSEPEAISAQVHRAGTGDVDLVTAQLRWAGGTTASYTASFMAPAGMPGNGHDRLELFGDGWAARMRMNPRPIEVWDEKALWPMPLEIRADPDGPTGMMAGELRCFCRVVRGLESIPTGASYQDGLQVQRWMQRIEAAYSTP